MSLTEKQIALKAYLTTGPAASIPFEDPEAGLENNTKTLAEWVAIGNTRAIGQIVNYVEIGHTLGLTIPAGEIDSRLVQKAVFRGAEYPTRLPEKTRGDIQFGLIYPTFNMSDEIMVQTMESILQPSHNSLPDDEKPLSCLSFFQELKTRTATISEHFGGINQDDINAIVAPE